MIGRRRRAPQTVERIFSRHRLLLLLVLHHYVLLLFLLFLPISFYSSTRSPTPHCPVLFTFTSLAATVAAARHSFLCAVVRTVTGRQRRYSCCTAILPEQHRTGGVFMLTEAQSDPRKWLDGGRMVGVIGVDDCRGESLQVVRGLSDISPIRQPPP